MVVSKCLCRVPTLTTIQVLHNTVIDHVVLSPFCILQPDRDLFSELIDNLVTHKFVDFEQL